MYLGFYTVCLGDMPLKEKAEWAGKNGFKSLEIACWPKVNSRDYSSCDLDVTHFTSGDAKEVNSYFKENGLKISSLGYYDNNLHKDPETRKFINNHTKKCIDATNALGVGMVGTFVGRDETKTIEENFDEYEKVFGDLVNYADKKNVKLMIENCPMPGWQVKGMPGTISYTPELWDEMFRRIPDKNFGLNYDPSHLVWQFIDYVDIIPKYIDRIFHVHAKDTEIFKDKLNNFGVFDKQLDSTQGSGYWRYRMPGLGQVDWGKVIKALKDNGYEGVVSTEHEDPVYEGSKKKVEEGLILGRKHLEKFI